VHRKKAIKQIKKAKKEGPKTKTGQKIASHKRAQKQKIHIESITNRFGYLSSL
jgi:ribosomal protein L20A (L18A)